MAAPSNTVWGDKVKDYDRVGISISQSYTNGQCTVTAEVWFWTKYSLTDSSYNLYFDFDTTSATTSQSEKLNKIQTSNDSGSGWSTKNQVKLGTYTKTYDLTTNEFSRSCAVKVNGLSNTSSDVTATTSYSVDALPRYTLSFNANGGSVSETSRTLFYGYEYGDLPTPTRTGYTFTGWYTQQSGGTKLYNTTTMGSSNVTIYAHWRANKLTTKYYINGGTVSSGNYYSDTDGLIYLKSTSNVLIDVWEYGMTYSNGLYNASTFNLSKQGYTFQGWKVGFDGEKTFNEDNITLTASDFTNAIENGDCEVTFYAVWRANILTINYHINGGTISSDEFYSSNSIVYDGGTKQILNDIRTYNNAETWGLYDAGTFGLYRQGYKFLGWKVGSNGTTIFEENGVDIKPTDLTSDINTGDCKITMYAVWELITYTITFDANGGSGAPEPQTKYYGDTLTISTVVPVRDGYKFLGWSLVKNGDVVYTPGSSCVANEDLTMYAVYTVLEMLGVIHINKNNTWKKGISWIKVNSVWKRGILHKKINGVWKQGGI